jgi:hypothetical protein
MAATKRLMVLSPNQIMTAKTWYSFIGINDIAEVDKATLNRISASDTVVLNERSCLIFMRWWNYLPSEMIDHCDRDLYDTLRDFLYD